MGRKKTYAERMEEMRLRKEWLKRQSPLKSPCLPGRRRHCFGRGIGKIHKECVYCGKSREQIRAEQRGIEVVEITSKCLECFYEGSDFRFFPKSGYVVCPKCKSKHEV